MTLPNQLTSRSSTVFHYFNNKLGLSHASGGDKASTGGGHLGVALSEWKINSPDVARSSKSGLQRHALSQTLLSDSGLNDK